MDPTRKRKFILLGLAMVLFVAAVLLAVRNAGGPPPESQLPEVQQAIEEARRNRQSQPGSPASDAPLPASGFTKSARPVGGQ